jgi:hypothetical protein
MEKNAAQNTKSIPAGHCMVIYGGIVQISTAGMGAQSRLHDLQFGSRKRIIIEIMRDKVCDKRT